MADIARYVRDLVDAIRGTPSAAAPPVAPPGPPVAPPPRRGRAPRAVAVGADPKLGADTKLGCPRCGKGTLLTGARGWGCSRWRDGCGFVIWFRTAGRTVSAAQLRDLVQRGRTRKTKLGTLVLDAALEGGARLVT